MTVQASQLEEIEQFTSNAVQTVFDTMLAMTISPDNSTFVSDDKEEEIVSSVGFIGRANGAIFIYSTVSFATLIASRMLGLADNESASREMVHDVLGELTNMVVGGVKSRLCDGGHLCSLTIPSIVRGNRLRIERPARVLVKELGFNFDQHHILVEILLKQYEP